MFRLSAIHYEIETLRQPTVNLVRLWSDSAYAALNRSARYRLYAPNPSSTQSLAIKSPPCEPSRRLKLSSELLRSDAGPLKSPSFVRLLPSTGVIDGALPADVGSTVHLTTMKPFVALHVGLRISPFDSFLYQSFSPLFTPFLRDIPHLRHLSR